MVWSERFDTQKVVPENRGRPPLEPAGPGHRSPVIRARITSELLAEIEWLRTVGSREVTPLTISSVVRTALEFYAVEARTANGLGRDGG